MAINTGGAEVDDDLPADISSLTVDMAAQGRRLDQWLADAPQAYSRAYVQNLIERGAVALNGQPCSLAAKRLRLGQRVEVQWWPPEADLAFVPEPMPLAVLHEDDDLLVVNKPAGLVVHPAAGNWRGTLLNGLLAHHAGAAVVPRAGIVHRLDKDTSGLMVVAKTLTTFHALVADLAARRVRREYLALCQGRWSDPQSVEAPIGRDPRSRIKMAVLNSGRDARTDFAPIQLADDATWLHCRLHTGRTHQIRVHAAHAGHPLIADATYGGKPGLGLQRQALHAARLSLVHPTNQATLTWTCPPPPDLEAACFALWGELPGLPTVFGA